MENYEESESAGNIRTVEVLGIDALGHFVVLDLVAGPPDGGKGLPLGKWTLPIAVARQLARDLRELLEDDRQAGAPRH